MDNLKNIFNQETKHLQDAIKNGKNSYHTFTLCTIKDKYPDSRTVVLRNFTKNPLKIYFNADYRSPKINQLKNNSLCSALFYDRERKIQLRFKCKPKIHYNNQYSKKVWEKTALQSRKCYMGEFKPSDILEDWHPNIPKKYLKTDPEKKDSEKGYINFTHIELDVIELDILQLHHDGHIRFKINNDKYNYLAP